MKQCIFFTSAWLFMFLLLLYILEPLVKVPIEKNDELEQHLRVLSRRVSHAFRELDKLRKQNEGLKLLIKLGLAGRNDTIRTMLEREKSLNEGKAIQNCNPVPPTAEYEQSRRMTENAVRDTWTYIRAKMEYLMTVCENGPLEMGEIILKEIKSLLINSGGRIQFILKYLSNLPMTDGHASWRKSEAKYLSQIVQNRIKLLQNPPMCATAKILQCSFSSDCKRLACRLERATACLAEAYRLLRTLVIDDNAWNANFVPLSQMCSDIRGSGDYPSAPWPGSPNDLRLELGLEDKVSSWKVVPYDFSTSLNRLKGDPLLWWQGQLYSYLMRPLPSLNNLFHQIKNKIKFFRNPIVGICLDDEKMIDDVIHAVEHHYQQLEITAIAFQRRIFVSSNSSVIPQKIQNLFPHIDTMYVSEELMIEVGAEEFAEDGFEFQKELLEVHFLQKADFIVSASAANKLCHIALALKTNETETHNKIVAINTASDSDYKRHLDYLAIIKHVAQNDEEIDLHLGDEVINVENLLNGYSRGYNKVGKRLGLFPSYKVASLTRYKQFYDFKDMVSTTRRAQENEQPTTEEDYEYED